MSRSRPLSTTAAGLFIAIFLGSSPGGAAAREQRQEASRSFDRTVTVASGQSLRIEHRHGNIRITTHASGELHVQAAIRVSADSQQTAAELLDRIQVEMADAPSAVTVRTRYPEQQWFRSNRNLSFAVDYTILMPERMPLDVKNSFGNVSATGVKAEAVIVNAHGTLTVADAGRSRLENSFGAIDVARTSGDVTITGSNGNVAAATVGGALTVTHRFGRVTVSTVRGVAIIANSNGHVDLADAASATVTNSFGTVTLRDVRNNATVINSNGAVTGAGLGGPAKLTTSFGAIDVKDVTGDLTIENSNGAVKIANVRGGATARTSFAPLEAAGVSGAVSATNSNGAISLRDIGAATEVRGSFGRIDVQAVKAGVRIATGNSDVRAMNVGPLFVKTSFGLVSAERVAGSLTVDNANGGVQATGVAGAADIKTSFGPVVLRDVGGAVTVRNQNGSIDASVSGKPGCHDVTLATTFSPIQVHLPEAGYVVTATTSFGRIQSDVPITSTGTVGEGTLSGTIGAGGCALRLTNANGDIRILKATPGEF
jgi:DUF4097 and DUF4098 domain-containing protein YvlB